MIYKWGYIYFLALREYYRAGRNFFGIQNDDPIADYCFLFLFIPPLSTLF